MAVTVNASGDPRGRKNLAQDHATEGGGRGSGGPVGTPPLTLRSVRCLLRPSLTLPTLRKGPAPAPGARGLVRPHGRASSFKPFCSFRKYAFLVNGGFAGSPFLPPC